MLSFPGGAVSPKKGAKKALNQFFYQMREVNDPEMFANFLQTVKRYQQVEIEEKE